MNVWNVNCVELSAEWCCDYLICVCFGELHPSSYTRVCQNWRKEMQQKGFYHANELRKCRWQTWGDNSFVRKRIVWLWLLQWRHGRWRMMMRSLHRRRQHQSRITSSPPPPLLLPHFRRQSSVTHWLYTQSNSALITGQMRRSLTREIWGQLIWRT